MDRKIILLGVKHSGKSTIGKLLSEKCKTDFYDTDEVIKMMQGKTPRELYDEGGASLFQEAEQRACDYLSLTAKPQSVIATGGGICDNQPAIKILSESGLFVFLNVSEDTAFTRIAQSAKEDKRWPSYISKENPKTEQDAASIFHRFYERRNQSYSEIADITVSSDKMTPEETVNMILKELNH